MLVKTIYSALKKVRKFNWLFLLASFISAVAILGLSAQSNMQIAQRAELDKQINSLRDEVTILKTNSTELESVGRIEAESQRLELVRLQRENVLYLNSAGQTVALRD